MFASKILKAVPFLVLTLLNVYALSARAEVHAREGGMSGGGGDTSEIRFDEIRSDILKWISQGGASGLRLPPGTTLQTYQSKMSALLAPHAVIVAFVTTSQERGTSSTELRVSVDGQPKTCRGFISSQDGVLHILCNAERFAATSQSDQYRLVHHEYAGLARIEQNVGASSDYFVSAQLTDYLVPQTVMKLSIKRASQPTPEEVLGTYSRISAKVVNGQLCQDQLQLSMSEDGEVFEYLAKSSGSGKAFADYFTFGVHVNMKVPVRVGMYDMNRDADEPACSRVSDGADLVCSTQKGRLRAERNMITLTSYVHKRTGIFSSEDERKLIQLVPLSDSNLQVVSFKENHRTKKLYPSSNCVYRRQSR